MAGDARRRAERRGHRAEALAAAWLRLKGYRILGRRVRTPVGEIDLVAARAGSVVAVEVKARPTVAEALEAVSPRQRHRIVHALNLFLARHPGLAGCDRRLDLVAVRPWRPPCHIRDLWHGDR